MALALAVNSSTPLPKRVLCIYHPIQFKKDQVKFRALLKPGREVSAMTPVYLAKLSLKI